MGRGGGKACLLRRWLALPYLIGRRPGIAVTRSGSVKHHRLHISRWSSQHVLAHPRSCGRHPERPWSPMEQGPLGCCSSSHKTWLVRPLRRAVRARGPRPCADSAGCSPIQRHMPRTGTDGHPPTGPSCTLPVAHRLHPQRGGEREETAHGQSRPSPRRPCAADPHSEQPLRGFQITPPPHVHPRTPPGGGGAGGDGHHTTVT